MSNKLLFGDWRIRGLGHPIRFLMKYIGADFDEKIYDYHEGTESSKIMEEWLAEKFNLGLAFPNIPYLIDGPIKVTEQQAIMRHLCRTRKPELFGTTVESQTKMDMVFCFMADWVWNSFVPLVYFHTDEKHKNYKENTEPAKLKLLTEFMGDNQWLAGNELTMVDFFAYESFHHMTVYDPKCFDNHPKVKGYMKRFEELPAIKAYMESPEFIKAPCYSPMAKYKI